MGMVGEGPATDSPGLVAVVSWVLPSRGWVGGPQGLASLLTNSLAGLSQNPLSLCWGARAGPGAGGCRIPRCPGVPGLQGCNPQRSSKLPGPGSARLTGAYGAQLLGGAKGPTRDTNRTPPSKIVKRGMRNQVHFIFFLASEACHCH